MPKQAKVHTFISQTLHNLLFLEEFVFARNKFKTPANQELELADAVVMIGDVLFIYQIKERTNSRKVDVSAERKWFKDKVLREAMKQVRDTLGYLQTYPEVFVPNERGHVFNLAASSFRNIIKIVVYAPSPNLPQEYRGVRHHVSRTAGFIHIIDAQDYLDLSRTLRVPREVIEYFEFRERILTHHPDVCANLPEVALTGHYIVAGGDSTTPPTIQSAIRLRSLVQDAGSWDLAPLLRDLHKGLSDQPASTKYYDILLEFMKLTRSGWRAAKERIERCIEKATNDEFSQPYRMVEPQTGCGFVFVPIKSEFTRRPDWPAGRLRLVLNYTMLHKYECRLAKCVGYLVAKDGEYLYTDWCLVSHNWAEDPDLQRALEEDNPFRPIRKAEVYGYFLTEGDAPQAD
jgi:hypothetical protein